MRTPQVLNPVPFFVLVWMLGSLLSYGHIVKQLKAEIAVECEKQYPNQNAQCPQDIRITAFASSIVAWPYHWSEEAWK